MFRSSLRRVERLFRNPLKFFAAALRVVATSLERPALVALYARGISASTYAQLDKPWLKNLGLATILDIGANTGQFASGAHARFPAASIYSFEPLPECFAALQKRMSGAENFSAFNLALGESSSHAPFVRSASSPSSSPLAMTEAHKAAFPWTSGSERLTVRMERLDDVCRNLEITEPMLVKIDVQGYEKHVLIGGERTVRRADVLIIEVSFVTLYHGQALFEDIDALLRGWGFRLEGFLDQLRDSRDQRILQADAIYVNTARDRATMRP